VSEGPLSRLTRALLLGGAAVVLLLLVAVAAGGYRPSGSSSSHASPYAIDTLVTVAFALYAIFALAVMVGMFTAGLELRRGGQAPSRGRKTFSLVALFLLLAGAAALSSGRIHLNLPFANDRGSGSAIEDSQTRQRPVNGTKTHDPQLRLVPFLAVVAVAGGGVAALLVAEKRRRRRLPKQADVTGELAGVLEVTLDDLRSESDPRRAVIAAYARMEAALAAHGIPRRRFEAPHEYLARVLDDLTHGGRGARQLTGLFERARFSTHEIDPSLKDEAIAAVESLQDELAAAQLERAA
jgi:hypothetical protein